MNSGGGGDSLMTEKCLRAMRWGNLLRPKVVFLGSSLALWP